MEIRKCTPNEISAVEKFYSRLLKFMIDNGVDFPKWRYKNFSVSNYADSMFICLEGEKIIGAFALAENAEKYFVVHSLAVAQDFQKRGVAKKIIEYCANYAKNKNSLAIRADVVPDNFPARKLLENCGFKFVGEIDSGLAIPEVPKFCLYERKLYE